MAKKSNPWKDKYVFLRRTWGDRRGQVDEDNLYHVRRIGAKMAILDRVNKQTKEINSYRGYSQYIYPKEVCDQRNQGGSWSHYFWDWGQIFVLEGNAGWDPDWNV